MRQDREREERVRQEREREERVRQERVKEERERKERVRQEREREERVRQERVKEERVRQERKKDVKRENNNNNNKVCSRLQSEFVFLPQAGLLQVKKEKKALLFPSATMEGVHLPWKTILGLILVYSSSA